jgi:predicted small integral membrane protein
MRTLIDRLGNLPAVTTILTAIMASYMTLVAFGNITDFGTNQAFVQNVFDMGTTFNDPDLMWRAIENDTIANVAYLGIIVWETLTALVLWWGVVRLIVGFRNDDWDGALGLLMMMILFAFGFITIGGEWFAMWQSSQWTGLDPALQNFILAGTSLILLHLPSRDWTDLSREATRGEHAAPAHSP